MYSRLDLTFKNDKLPAVSAIAGYIAEATGDRYLAGLWSGDLYSGLLWSVTIPEWSFLDYLKVLTSDYIAPSWSWAASSGGVE